MRSLIILRHAKSSWALPGVEDFDRPLNESGRNATPRMANWLIEQGYTIDHILCSPAVRTSETLELLCDTMDTKPPVTFHDDLYLASRDTILSKVSKLDKAVKTAMVIGHNPGLHDAALELLTPDQRSASGELRSAFPTAACAIIECPIDDWADISRDIGTLNAYMVPKALKLESAE